MIYVNRIESEAPRTIGMVGLEGEARITIEGYLYAAERVLHFETGEELLTRHSEIDYVVAGLRTPDISLAEFHERWAALNAWATTIVVAEHRHLPQETPWDDLLHAGRQGVLRIAFLPCEAEKLRRIIEEAASCGRQRKEACRQKQSCLDRLRRLNNGERQVVDLLYEGFANKQIATRLGVAMRTVEHRRCRILQKLDLESLAELIRLVAEAEISQRLIRNGFHATN
jgi:FixJ family two-component response regulator